MATGYTTVFILLRPAGSIQDYRHFAAGFIGILLNKDAGSIGINTVLDLKKKQY